MTVTQASARHGQAAAPGRPAVLIMAKAPVPGLVKTRLEPLLGPRGCAALQRELIRLATATAVAAGPLTTFLAVAPGEAASDVGALAPAGVRTLRQDGNGLGDRLTSGVATLFGGGFHPVVVIGTDVPTLTASGLRAAFGALAEGHDVVFGPALDGGYYLVGLNAPAAGVFDLAPELWGGPEVLAASLAAARAEHLRVSLLPALSDLDTPADAEGLLADPALPRPVARLLTPPPAVSIVMPALNEAAAIEDAVRRLRRDFPGCELIVADGGSSDGTAAVAARHATVITTEPGRAAQLNAGAGHARGEVLWFIHADTRVEPEALDQIRLALADQTVVGGGLRLRFDQPGFALRYVACTSNLRARWLHWVFGDQAMFIRRQAFESVGGFPLLPIMEDLEMSRRLGRLGRLAVVRATATTSARRFIAHGTWRTLAFMQYLKLLYFLGHDPRRIADMYRAGPRRRRTPERKLP